MSKLNIAFFILILIFIISCTSTKPIKKNETIKVDLELLSLRLYLSDNADKLAFDRVYNTKFNNKKINFIWYDLILKNNSILTNDANDQQIVLKEIWLNNTNNLELSKFERELSIPLNEEFINYSAGFSKDSNWESGSYLLKIYINNKEYGNKEFIID